MHEHQYHPSATTVHDGAGLCAVILPCSHLRVVTRRCMLQVTQHVDLPMSVVYIVQLLTFGGGFFGITYGILSASWDPMREGSVLGFTEFKANLPLILDRVKSRGGKGRV